MDNNRGRNNNFFRPGRGGFNERQQNYGDQRGYNSSSYGRWTWTFYEEDQWRRFKDWLKEDSRREETERNKVLVRSLAEILQEERVKKKKEGKEKPKKKKKEEVMSDSSGSEEEVDETKTDSSPEKKLKKKNLSSRKKKMEKLFVRLKEMEEENKKLKEKSEVALKKSTPKGSAKISPEDSDEEEEVSDLVLRKKVNEDDVELLKKIEKEFNSKEGTKLLKRFCKDNEIIYKNKTEAIWAVLAFKKGGK